MSEVLEKNRQYEADTYGLSDAVAEIKECKTQIQIRDRLVKALLRAVMALVLMSNLVRLLELRLFFHLEDMYMYMYPCVIKFRLIEVTIQNEELPSASDIH